MNQNENYINAVIALSSAKNVAHWNEIRSYVKNEYLTNEQMSKIDGSGLIVKILGQDNHPSYNA